MRPWTRDNRILVAIGLALGVSLTALYALALRARSLSPAAATNRVLLFVLFYIVVLLILVLVFVLGRNAVHLLVDARSGVFGSRFRLRIVGTYVGLALLPIALLMLPTTGLLQRSVETWFQPAVAETARAGQAVSDLLRERAAALETRTGERLAGPLAAARTDVERLAALSAARESSGLDLLEWRPDGAPDGASPVAVSSPRWPVRQVNDPGPGWIEEARGRGVSRRLEALSSGAQIGRSVMALPGGVLVLGVYDPPAEAANLRALARATAAYAALESERASLAAVQVLFFLLLAFLVLLAAVWAGLLLARRVTRPIAALAKSARRVGAGDFDALVEVEGGDEIAALSGAFNSMTAELKGNRERLVAAAAEMAETNRRLDDERRVMKTILAHLEAGVIGFTDDRRLLGTNERARRLLGRAEGPAPSTLDELLSCPSVAPVRELLDRAVDGTGPREATLHLLRGGEGLVVEARLARVPAQPGEAASWVVTLEDTTALVKAERAAAWEEAARRMAHEIKNPLTPIRLAAERMRRRAASGAAGLPAVVEEGASTIVEEVRTLSALVDAFGRFARLPAADLAETDLSAVVQQVTKLYAGVKKGVSVSAELPPTPLPPVRADAEQLKRALINLVDNAVSATPSGGAVRVAGAVEGGTARLVVADDGPGIPEADRPRVFDPAYSTKPRGTGLGLAITARIAAEHAGRVFVEENSPTGCRFVLEWPAA